MVKLVYIYSIYLQYIDFIFYFCPYLMLSVLLIAPLGINNVFFYLNVELNIHYFLPESCHIYPNRTPSKPANQPPPPPPPPPHTHTQVLVKAVIERAIF